MFSSLESQPHGAAGLCEWSSIFMYFFFESSEPVLLPARRQSTVAQRACPTLGSRAASQPPVREGRARVPSASKHFIFPPNQSYQWAFSWAPYYSQMTCHTGPFTVLWSHQGLLPSREIFFSLENVTIIAAKVKM